MITKMKLSIYFLTAIAIISACTNAREPGNSATTSAVVDQSNHITLTPAQMAAIKLRMGQIETQTLENVIRANGYLDVPPQNKAVISPMITGFIRKVNFLVGDQVRKGQTMAELESLEFIEMQQNYREMSARVKYLQGEYERQKTLQEQNAVSKKRLLQAELEYSTTMTVMEGLKSKLDLLGVDFSQLNSGHIQSVIHLKAPISGSVKRQNTMIGKHVDPSEEIYEIVNTAHLHLELSVYEKDVIHVAKGQKVWYTVASLENTVFEGDVFLVGSDLSEEKRTINVHVHIDENEANFAVGMYANASIVVEEKPSLILPITAVVVDGGEQFIFRQVSNAENASEFERISVVTGNEANGFAEISASSDIVAGDQVVVEGAFYLLNAYEQLAVN